jgi:hypothetical protein
LNLHFDEFTNVAVNCFPVMLLRAGVVNIQVMVHSIDELGCRSCALTATD